MSSKKKQLDQDQEELLAEISQLTADDDEATKPKQPTSYHEVRIKEDLRKQNEELIYLRNKVHTYEIEGNLPNGYIDPWSVGISEAPNRTPASLEDEAYEALKESIEAYGGNTQPIKVRRRQEWESTDREGQDEHGEKQDVDYILVCGERRLRICRDLGIQVWAIFALELDPEKALVEQILENEQRESLSAYEQARQWQYALDRCAFNSLRDFARQVGISKSVLSERLRILNLPDEFFHLIGDPSYLSGRDYLRVLELHRDHGDRLVQKCKEIAEEAGCAESAHAATQRLNLLKRALQSHTDKADGFRPVEINGQLAYRKRMLQDGSMMLQIPRTATEEQWHQIEKALEQVFKEKAE